MGIGDLKEKTVQSDINYNYQTIRITKSRIDKGLIAIPRSLKNFFPQTNTKIKIYFNDASHFQLRNFTSFIGSTNENRIGGMRDWFLQNKMKDGDEIVLQIVDEINFVYRLIPEKFFISKIKEYQNHFDRTEDFSEADSKLDQLATWTLTNKKRIFFNEFYRLIKKKEVPARQLIKKEDVRFREKTPNHIRTLLGAIYQGQCQVCKFSFLKRDRTPYYEIHHLNPVKGHHPKNLVLVCANCHCQFEYSRVSMEYNDYGWLIAGKFNEKSFQVHQAVSNEYLFQFTKEVYS